jgi:nucleobase transporter 1/2
MPGSMVSGLFCVMFGLIASVGLSQMQHTDQNSPRNLFILGFALYMGLSVPYYFDTYKLANGFMPINTSAGWFNGEPATYPAALHVGLHGYVRG